MGCIVYDGDAGFDQGTWAESLFRQAHHNRIPLSGMLELTSRCNLRCIHCYLGNQDAQHAKRAMEMDTEQLKSLLDELAEAGTLFLTITGGDPMMRKDFVEIYAHGVRLGMLVIVFCDGVLVSDKIISAFQELPPRRVEISIYGATEETYEKVTRIKGSYRKCIRGIERLLNAGITVALKTILMSTNEHEFEHMRQMAEDYGVPFRFDAAIFPCLPDSSQEPLALRISKETAISHELASETARRGWIDHYEERKAPKQRDDRLFKCGAGARAFYVGPFGEISPCVLTTKHRFDRGSRSFMDVWNDEMLAVRQLKVTRTDTSCGTCEKRSMCNNCPAFSFLETGEEDLKSEYQCELTHERWRQVFGETEEARAGHPRLPIIKGV